MLQSERDQAADDLIVTLRLVTTTFTHPGKKCKYHLTFSPCLYLYYDGKPEQVDDNRKKASH
ncbi:MAG TPA: hypothetical protein DHW02_20135 [Ktedonobacter sp.]|nr:hypothetical protein [Ktedonobacter sp.]